MYFQYLEIGWVLQRCGRFQKNPEDRIDEEKNKSSSQYNSHQRFDYPPPEFL
jgi:hypothetical protein